MWEDLKENNVEVQSWLGLSEQLYSQRPYQTVPIHFLYSSSGEETLELKDSKACRDRRRRKKERCEKTSVKKDAKLQRSFGVKMLLSLTPTQVS